MLVDLQKGISWRAFLAYVAPSRMATDQTTFWDAVGCWDVVLSSVRTLLRTSSPILVSPAFWLDGAFESGVFLQLKIVCIAEFFLRIN